MFEKKHEPIAPLSVFFLRLTGCFCLSASVIMLAICIGILGFHTFDNMSWLNAFENSAMILSTMGPVLPITTNIGKVFASFYALFSGLVFVTMMGVLFAPVLHRVLHIFHSEHH